MTSLPNKVEIPLSSLAEISAHFWKLNDWLSKRRDDESLAVPRYVNRKLQAFIEASGVSFLDLTGHSFDAGLAIEVVDTITRPIENNPALVIGEMIRPVVLWHGTVIKQGEVVLHKSVERQDETNEVIAE